MNDTQNWIPADLIDGVFRFPFRQAETISGSLCIQATEWNEDGAVLFGEDVSMR
ncbi:hypothetical protein [Dyadobacter sp. 3J3]|uniref:hypothetical protein n=1 Tax=Dyadobacter sp. 3J3 TaxID=2606600 RepID=UPI00135B8BE1|nr:hypothetical protein [Dyadobacter sp. 3J3]